MRGSAKGGPGSGLSGLYSAGLLAVLAVAAVMYVLSPGEGPAASRPVTLEGLDDPESLVALARGVTLGDSAAPVSILEFGDYQCPACGYFARNVKPQLEAALVQSGRAKLVFHDLPLVSIHPNAFLAARAARCAEDQGRFWEYHDELYRLQERWATSPSPSASFKDYAETLQLEVGTFEACLGSDRHADLVTANMELARALRLNSTPSVIVAMGAEARHLEEWDVQSILSAVEEMTR